VFVPGAFTPPARPSFAIGVAAAATYRDRREMRAKLAANAVCIGNTLVMSGCSERLRADLGNAATAS